MRHIIKQGSFAFGRWRSVCSTGFLFSVRPQCWRTSIRTQADIYRGEWYFTALKVIFTPYSDISPIGIGCDLKLSRDSGPARVRAQTHDRTQRSFRTVCGHLHNNTGEGSRARRSCSSSSRAASKHAEGGGAQDASRFPPTRCSRALRSRQSNGGWERDRGYPHKPRFLPHPCTRHPCIRKSSKNHPLHTNISRKCATATHRRTHAAQPRASSTRTDISPNLRSRRLQAVEALGLP